MADKEQADPEATRIKSIDDRFASLKDEIVAEIKGLFGGGDKQEKAEPAGHGSLDEQIRSAVASVSEQEKAKTEAQRKHDETENRIKKLEQLSEKPPREYRRLTKVLWGGDE